VTARDDAAGLRERVEALAEGYDVEADSICPADEYDKADKAWRVAHVRRRVAADLRALLAESTPAPAPAADGGEARRLADELHLSLPAMCETDEDYDAPPCWTLAQRLLASDWLADIRRTARAEGAEEALEAAAEALTTEEWCRASRNNGYMVPISQTIRGWLRARATGGPQ
jgi:hypothetical protein